MPKSALSNLRSYAQTLEFQGSEQIAGRARWVAALALYRILARFGVSGLIERVCDLHAGDAQANPWFVYPAAAGDDRGGWLGAGRFCFLNEIEDLGDPVEWNPPAKSLLWRFH